MRWSYELLGEAERRVFRAVAEEAAAGLETSTAELAAARRLDAEDTTMRQALAWALEQDAAIAVRVAAALAPWWYLRGRSVSQYPLLREAAGRAAPGSEQWCTAQYWLGNMALDATDPAAALDHFDAVIDAMRARRPYRAVAYCLGGRSVTLLNQGLITEATECGPQPGGPGGLAPATPATVSVVTVGGMAGWQITVIALGAALVAAVAAVLLDRALAARRAASATTA